MSFRLHDYYKVMFFWLHDGLALFRFYRLKIIFSLISIMIGIAAITAIISLKNSVDIHVQQLINKFSQTRFVVSMALNESLQRELNQTGRDFGNAIWRFDERIQLIPYHTANYPTTFNFTTVSSNTLTISMAAVKQMQWHLVQGRIFNTLDEGQKVALIGSELANKIKALNQDPLNQFISINANYFKIIGILDHHDYDPLLDFDVNNCAIIGLEWLYRFQVNPTVDSWIVFSTLPFPEAKSVAQDLFATRFHAKQIYIRDLQIYHEALFSQVYFTLKILVLIATITLILGIISILNLLLVLLSERKNEVGLRLALGATPKDIGIQFLREALFLNMLGAVLGVSLGQIFAGVIAKVLGIHFYFIWQSVFFALVLALMLGMIIGIIPARMATKLRPFAMIQG